MRGAISDGRPYRDNYVMQTKKALVNVLRATDVFQMSQTGSGDLGLRRADPVVLVFLR